MTLTIVVVILLGLGFLFFYYPLQILDLVARRKLVSDGLKKKTLTTSHGKMTYFEGGAGKETVILIHGFMVHAGNWSQVAGDIAKKYHVIVPDLIGHGESFVPTPFNLQKILEGLEEFIEQTTGNQKVTIVGNSMGGWLTALYTARNPMKATKIILENSGGIEVDAEATILLPDTREQAQHKMYQLMDPKMKLPGFVLDNMIRLNQPKHYELLEDLASGNLFINELAPTIDVPVYIFWGTLDGLFPMEYLERFTAYFKSPTLVTFPDAAHLPHVTRKGAFLREFDKVMTIS